MNNQKKKRRTNILIESELIDQAKKAGINISRAAETAIKYMLAKTAPLRDLSDVKCIPTD